MTLESRDDGEVTILDLSGKLVLGDGDKLLRATFDELLPRGRSRIVINLENVPYMDSAGMGELISSQRKAVAAGGNVRLVNPLRRVYDILHAVKLDTVFQIFQEEAQAVESFRA